MNTLARQVRNGFKYLYIRRKCESFILKRQCYQVKTNQFKQTVINAQVQQQYNSLDKHVSSAAVRLKSTFSDKILGSICINDDGKFCKLKWNYDKETAVFHSAWLRHNCQCEQCHDRSSQKTIIPSQLSPDIRLVSCVLKEDSCIHMKLETNSEVHSGIIPLHFLQANSYSSQKLKNNDQKRKMVFKDGPIELSKFQYDSVIKSDRNLFPLLKDLNMKGISLLKNVPSEDGMVIKLAELFGPVMFTIYGEYFKVKSEENPINIAYSSRSLGFHMDLMYYESPPGLQLLHCVEFDNCVEGGENQFVDVFQVAEKFRIQHPKEFKCLCTIPATFQKIHYDREKPVHMIYQRPHIVLSASNDIIAINWSPEFEGPLAVHESKVEPYYKAYFLFAKCIEESPNIMDYRLEKGDAVVFNNRRVLHSRKEFVLNGGTRELHGCYVNIDEYKNRLQYLSNIFEGTGLVHRVGNQDWF